MKHIASDYFLHSHDIGWGSGSRQQSVTALSGGQDQGNFWLVKESFGEHMCDTGTPVACGQVVRLEHVQTGRNLHTHRVRSPLSKFQEVSCFGHEDEGDANDDWEVLCHSHEESQVAGTPKMWILGNEVQLRNTATGAYLRSSQHHRFTDANCPKCPIIGQQEVTAGPQVDHLSLWTSGSSGIWVQPARKEILSCNSSDQTQEADS